MSQEAFSTVVVVVWLVFTVWLFWGDLGSPRLFTPEWFRRRRRQGGE